MGAWIWSFVRLCQRLDSHAKIAQIVDICAPPWRRIGEWRTAFAPSAYKLFHCPEIAACQCQVKGFPCRGVDGKNRLSSFAVSHPIIPFDNQAHAVVCRGQKLLQSYRPRPCFTGAGFSRAFAFAVDPGFDFAGIHEGRARQLALANVAFIVGLVEGGAAQTVAPYCVGQPDEKLSVFTHGLLSFRDKKPELYCVRCYLLCSVARQSQFR